jgi:AraC-like DNA-binding protein
LRRRFDHDLGLSPKRYQRLVRFGRVIEHLRAPRRRQWCDVAATLGYSDQAHLIHEFRDFTGVTPTAFLADPASEQALRHGAVPRPRPRS